MVMRATHMSNTNTAHGVMVPGAKSDAAAHTAVTNVFTGRPARGIVNRLMRDLTPMNFAAPAFPLAATAVVALRAKAEAQGIDDFTAMWAGQNARACREASAAVLTKSFSVD